MVARIHPSLSVFKRYVSAMALHNWEEAAALMTDDWELVTMPASLKVMVQTKADVTESGGRQRKFFSSFAPGELKYDIQEVYEVDKTTAIFFATSEGVSLLGTQWKNEYFYVMLSDDSGKLRKATEFIDSGLFKEFLVRQFSAKTAARGQGFSNKSGKTRL